VRTSRANTAAVAIRGQLLLRLAAAPRPSIRQLAAELGLAPSAVDHHLSRAAAEGLLIRGQTLTLTPAGRTLATYLEAQAQGESVLRRLVRKHWGRYTRRAVGTLAAAARAVGLQTGALEQRVSTLIAKAKERGAA